MSKFCTNCGEELTDDAAACGKCGAHVEQPAAQSTEPCEACASTQSASQANGFAGNVNAFVGKVKNKDKKAIGIVGGVAAALILIIVLVICLGGGGPEGALDTYFDVLYKGKVSKVEKLAPPEFWEALEDKEDMDLDDAEEAMEEMSKTMVRSLEDEYGDDIKVSYKITETDEAKKSELDEIKDLLKSSYDIPKKNVTEAVELEVEITVEGDDDEDTNEETFYAVKIDGDWYIYNLLSLLG